MADPENPDLVNFEDPTVNRLARILMVPFLSIWEPTVPHARFRAPPRNNYDFADFFEDSMRYRGDIPLFEPYRLDGNFVYEGGIDSLLQRADEHLDWLRRTQPQAIAAVEAHLRGRPRAFLASNAAAVIRKIRADAVTLQRTGRVKLLGNEYPNALLVRNPGEPTRESVVRMEWFAITLCVVYLILLNMQPTPVTSDDDEEEEEEEEEKQLPLYSEWAGRHDRLDSDEDAGGPAPPNAAVPDPKAVVDTLTQAFAAGLFASITNF